MSKDFVLVWEMGDGCFRSEAAALSDVMTLKLRTVEIPNNSIMQR